MSKKTTTNFCFFLANAFETLAFLHVILHISQALTQKTRAWKAVQLNPTQPVVSYLRNTFLRPPSYSVIQTFLKKPL